MIVKWEDVAGWAAVAALVGVGILIWLAVTGIMEMSNLCARGGYAYSTNRLAGVDLCIGVIDGEWQIEPLADVRARLARSGEKVN